MDHSLSNLKILDFTTLLPGPFATVMLADMGAEVVRISSKSRYDLVFESGEALDDTLTAPGAWLGRNKKALSLNLKTPEAVAIVKRLIQDYDILIEQFRPGVMERLGLGYETLKALNPRLIYVSITAYGQTGPLKNRAAHDINFLARSGIMHASGRTASGPSLMNTQVGDLAGGALHGIIGLLSAVNERHVSGLGQHVDVAMIDALLPLNTLSAVNYLAGGDEPRREGEPFNGSNLYDFYETADGEYLSVAPLEPKFFNRFCELVPVAGLKEAGPYTRDPELKASLRRHFKGEPLSYWTALFKDEDCCVEPVLTLEEALFNPQTEARDMVTSLDYNGRTIRQVACPIHFSRTDNRYDHIGEPAGKDTYDLLSALGYSATTLQAWDDQGVFD
ncbi:CaiB/BaiF CoA-transferase family protein [Peptoniphilus equinus]|uniref:CaiB/BaiF CoA-transferase family protein n=1 Tax=Peptoniphilus equinus TaxID=3016343 RepID=A0ABY7QTC0_9FIRM|nr:CaiB/BaiF CoA-transferase family protein [Peptoniphilus equinus]WBW49591.1 CaiB/BaiF CoA-transferase family protein [Peptoniphilus equinus]